MSTDTAGTMPDGVRHDQAEQFLVNRRRARAAQMRRAGASYQQIADTGTHDDGTPLYPPGTGRNRVHGDIQRGLAEALSDLRLEANELRELESTRLDDYLLRLRPGIAVGDPKAINTAIRITETRARLYGLNEPERHEVITVDALDVERRRLVDEINRRAAAEALHDRRDVGAAPPQS